MSFNYFEKIYKHLKKLTQRFPFTFQENNVYDIINFQVKSTPYNTLEIILKYNSQINQNNTTPSANFQKIPTPFNEITEIPDNTLIGNILQKFHIL